MDKVWLSKLKLYPVLEVSNKQVHWERTVWRKVHWHLHFKTRNWISNLKVRSQFAKGQQVTLIELAKSTDSALKRCKKEAPTSSSSSRATITSGCDLLSLEIPPNPVNKTHATSEARSRFKYTRKKKTTNLFSQYDSNCLLCQLRTNVTKIRSTGWGDSRESSADANYTGKPLSRP